MARHYFQHLLWWLCGLSLSGTAHAQGQTLPEIIVLGSRDLLGTAGAANEGDVSRQQLEARPVYRPGELLETTPGLIVTQHSGEGKANQYFLRGFNLDHGTDLAITVDGMPVNLRTHGHGQGYSDINFLIPELARGLAYRKGPYFAEEGDFASAGAIHIGLIDSLPKSLAEIAGGSFGYARGFAATSTLVGQGTLLAAGELVHNDGPWRVPDDYQKVNGVLRYAEGTPENGLAVTGMAYAGQWTATNQIAKRAVDSGSIGRFDSLDPSDGGSAQRYSLSARWAQREQDRDTRVEAYIIRSELALYNDFTYFLRDPVNGDQIKQTDARTIYGVNASRAYYGGLAGHDMENLFGVQMRYDDIDVGLFNTARRTILSTVRDDHVQESSIGAYVQNTLHWTDWFRSIAGLRGDLFHADDASDNPLNSGSVTQFMPSPKLSLVLGPFAATEYYFNIGTGFHSNDVRGATIAVDPNDGVTRLDKVPLLVRSKGAEIGLRTQAIGGLQSSLSLFVLDLDSELVFAGDAGTTVAGRPSRRIGIEFANIYRPLPWLAVDLDAAYARARFTDAGPVGNHIPGAVEGVVDTGVEIDNLDRWFGAVRLRYFGPRALIEDNSVRSKPTMLLSARVGYKLTDGLRLRVDAFNLLNTKASQIDYFYTSRLRREPVEGVGDIHFHPVEPASFRVTLSAAF
jgi:outer membrane receptor protein involved in Fe transport